MDERFSQTASPLRKTVFVRQEIEASGLQTAQLKARLWELQSLLEGLRQNNQHDCQLWQQQSQQLRSQLSSLKQLLKINQKQKLDLLAKRNAQVKVQIDRIINSHQEVIIFYEAQKDELDLQINLLANKLQQANGNSHALQRQVQLLEARLRQQSQQLNHKQEMQNSLRKKLQETIQKGLKDNQQQRRYFQEKIESINADRLRDNVQHSRQVDALKQLHKLEQDKNLQSNQQKLDQMNFLIRGKSVDFQNKIVRLEQQLANLLIQLKDRQNQIGLLKSQNSQLNHNLSKRCQEIVRIETELSITRKNYQSVSRDRILKENESNLLLDDTVQLKDQVRVYKQQLAKMREILLESGEQMQRCRIEIVRGEKERQILQLQNQKLRVRLRGY